MDYSKLWTNKKVVARNTMHGKEKVHGIECEVEYLKEFLDIYGEESSQKAYQYKVEKLRLVFTGITGSNMLTYSELLSSTEQDTMYIQRFEDEALPRNTRIKLPQDNDDKYRLLEVRDTIKNEGTFVVLQELVPTLLTKTEFNEPIGRNLTEEFPDYGEPKKLGRNL